MPLWLLLVACLIAAVFLTLIIILFVLHAKNAKKIHDNQIVLLQIILVLSDLYPARAQQLQALVKK